MLAKDASISIQFERPDSGPYVAPRSDLEKLLVEVWEKVLKVSGLGVHDNFFEAGGHSIIATTAMVRVSKKLGFEVELQNIFEAPTVAMLAERISTIEQYKELITVPSMRRLPWAAVTPLSLEQESMWLMMRYGGVSAAEDVVRAYRLVGDLDIETLTRSLNAVGRKHEILRSTIQIVDGMPVHVLDEQAFALLERECIDTVSPEETGKYLARMIREFVLADSLRGKPLPVLRTRLFEINEREHILVVAVSHLVADDWAAGILENELTANYKALSTTASLPPEEPQTQYFDYIAWQRKLSQDLRATVNPHAYWRELLGSAQPTPLPHDNDRVGKVGYESAEVRFALSNELTSSLRHIAHKQGATLFHILMTAFVLLLSRWSARKEVVIGALNSMRKAEPTLDMIGNFVGLLPLRVSLEDHTTFGELLASIKQLMLDGQTHMDLPFSAISKDLGLPRPLCTSAVVYRTSDVPEAKSLTPSLEMMPLHDPNLFWGRGRIPFDLLLDLTDSPVTVSAALQFRKDFFLDKSVEGLAERYQTILAQIEKDSNVAVGTL